MFSRRFHRLAVIMWLRLVAVGAAAGAVLACPAALRAQEAEREAAEEEVAAEVQVDAELGAEQLYIDFVHFVMLGRYDIAEAYGRKLLADPEATPALLLDVADRQKNSREALIWVSGHPRVGELAQGILQRVREGESARARDAERINRYIQGLGGGLRAEMNNADRLRESGEYAIPWMLKALADPKQAALHPRIMRTLPKVGKAAVNPLVVALDTNDTVLKQAVIRALGEIGYPQAVPYLKRLLESPGEAEDVRQTAMQAVARILPSSAPMFSMSGAQAFATLADDYYNRVGSVRADVREPLTNVWYWRDDFLTPTAVPTKIYEEVMTMRCCEAALGLDPASTPAVALWLAANFRREARLGMDVASEAPDERNNEDATRPPGFLRGVYYARSAGPKYCHLVLGRAVKDRDAAVALGALAGLDATAGASSLVGPQDERQPLGTALTFPDLQVRIKAALALGKALPKKQFAGCENVVPVLAEALVQTGRRHAIVVDPDGESRNRVAGLLGEADVTSVVQGNLLEALSTARQELPDVDVVVVASDVAEPSVGEAIAILRRDFRFANTPVLLLAKAGQELACEQLAFGQVQVGVVRADAGAAALTDRWNEVAVRVGRVPVSPDQAVGLALAAAETLRLIAISNSPVYDFMLAETALIEALHHPSAELRVKAGRVLALARSRAAQRAIAQVALNADTDTPERLPAFESLAESAKRHGNLLEPVEVDELRELTMKAEDPVIKVNASRALGALNLPTHDATTIITESHGA